MDTHDKTETQAQNTDNPHDKGYKRIFSIKKKEFSGFYQKVYRF